MNSPTDGSHQLLRSAAVLEVSSRTMQPMIDYFVNQLGFSVGSIAGSGPSFAKLDRDGQTIMLNCTSHWFGIRRTRDWAAYFWVNDIEAIYSEFVTSGAKLKGAITEKPYGCNEVVAIAPDGREIVFGQLVQSHD